MGKGGGGAAGEDPQEKKRRQQLREELNRQALSRQLSGLSSARTILSALSQTSPTGNVNLMMAPTRNL